MSKNYYAGGYFRANILLLLDMQKTISISLLFIFSLTAVVPSTTWGDMAKIANLLEHYQVHKNEDSSLSFWSFMQLHYGADFQMHQTAHDHSKLPLKNATPSVCAFIIVNDIAYSTFNIITLLTIPEPQKAVLPSYVHIFTSQHLSDIWQPPRCC